MILVFAGFAYVLNDAGLSTTIVPFRGTIAATVSAAGKLGISVAGKTISSLKSGRYSISVRDSSANAGFAVQRARGQPITITTKVFVGRKATIVDLKPGQWLAFSPGSKTVYFFVTT